MSLKEQFNIMTLNCLADWTYIIIIYINSRNKYNKQTEERIESFKTFFKKVPHDIFCFQEVDFYYEWLKDLLDENGYESYYTRKPDCFGNAHNRDGVVIAFRTDKYKYEDYKPIEFPPIEGVNDGNVKAGTAGLLVHLSLRNNPSVLVTVHLAAFAANEEPRRIQIMHLLGRIYEYSKDKNYSVILTGDFNTESDSETFKTIQNSGYDILSNTELISYPKRNCTIDFVFGLRKRFKCVNQTDLSTSGINLYSDHNPISCLIEIRNAIKIQQQQHQTIVTTTISPPLPMPLPMPLPPPSSPIEEKKNKQIFQQNSNSNYVIYQQQQQIPLQQIPLPVSQQAQSPPLPLPSSKPLEQQKHQQQKQYYQIPPQYITYPLQQLQQIPQSIYSAPQQGISTVKNRSSPPPVLYSNQQRIPSYTKPIYASNTTQQPFKTRKVNFPSQYYSQQPQPLRYFNSKY